MMDLIVSHPIAAAAIALAAVLAGLLGRALFLGDPPAVVAGSIMSRRQQALVAACADAFFPPGGAIPVSGSEAGLVKYMDGYLRRLSPRSRSLVQLLFAFLEHSPFVFGPRPRRFSQLGLADRLKLLGAMATSEIYFRRIAFLSMRTMLTMGYLANARVAAAMQMETSLSPFEQKTAGAKPASAVEVAT